VPEPSRVLTRGGVDTASFSDSAALSVPIPSYQCLIVRDGISSSFHSLCVKNETVRLPCASRSMSRTLRPRAARPAPRFAVSVVLPTPPLWLMTETTFTVLLHVDRTARSSAGPRRGERKEAPTLVDGPA
jgi:hypothetical protein